MMALRPTHELHRRRFGRNVWLGLTLVALIGVVFGLTVVKVTSGGLAGAFERTAPAETTEARE